jgi:Schlafen, AlbA_2
MATDLYSVDLRSLAGSDLYRAIVEFVRIDRPQDDRPREGYLLDFKEDLSDRFLRSVAAFANTFGGLLVVGVSEDDGRPDKLVGVITSGELKTRVASVIASNIFPCPPFEIAECGIPSDPDGRKLCVVRVREANEICLLARKGEKNPVYVRVEDQSSPADASQLRSLLNRKRQGQDLAADLDRRISELAASLFVCRYRESSQGNRSNTYFQITICPYTHPAMRLDLATEQIFGRLVSTQNPGLQALVNVNEAKVVYRRSRDWCEMQFLDQAHDYERRFRLTSRADIGFITQVGWPITPGGEFWSLYDVAADLVNVGALAREFCRETGYYGGFRLVASLNIGGLGFEADRGALEPLFYGRLSGVPGFSLDFKSVIMVKGPPPLPQVAQAEIDLDYTSLGDSLSATVTTVVNQLLRCLGHLAHFQALQRSIDLLFFG